MTIALRRLTGSLHFLGGPHVASCLLPKDFSMGMALGTPEQGTATDIPRGNTPAPPVPHFGYTPTRSGHAPLPSKSARGGGGLLGLRCAPPPPPVEVGAGGGAGGGEGDRVWKLRGRPPPGKSRAVLRGGVGEERVRNTNRNERSQGRSLLHGQNLGNTQNHRNSVVQCLAVGGGWRLAVGGPWGLSLRAVLNKKKKEKLGFIKTALGKSAACRSRQEQTSLSVERAEI